MGLTVASAPDVGAGGASLVPSSRGRRHSSRVLASLLNAYVSHPPSNPPLRLLVLPPWHRVSLQLLLCARSSCPRPVDCVPFLTKRFVFIVLDAWADSSASMGRGALS
jgi:hypothetical protein